MIPNFPVHKLQFSKKKLQNDPQNWILNFNKYSHIQNISSVLLAALTCFPKSADAVPLTMAMGLCVMCMAMGSADDIFGQ